MERADILSLVSKAEAMEFSDKTMNSKLGVITVKELKTILEAMGKTDW